MENLPLARDHRVRKQCSALLDAGFGVSVICQRDPRNRASVGIDLHEYPPPPTGDSRASFAYEYAYSWAMAALLTIKVFFLRGFQAIQTCNPPDIQFALAAPFKLLGKRLVVDQRDLSPELYVARYGGAEGAMVRALRLLERVTLQTADHVFCVNDTLAQTAHVRGGKPRTSITVIRNGPVLARTHDRRPRRELKRGKPFMCCWVGVMGPQDHTDLALAAVHHLVHDRGRTDCHFAFVGEGDCFDRLRDLAGELDLREWVEFTGWLDEDAAFDHIASADIGLETNLQDEVSPVKAMEYMAFAVPVIAFDVRETRSTAGPAAVYVAPGDVAGFAGSISELLDDPSRRGAMGATGRARVENLLAWDRQKERYIDVYDRLIRHPAAPAKGDPSRRYRQREASRDRRSWKSRILRAARASASVRDHAESPSSWAL